MADNYLITGYWGEPHVTSENDRGINAAIFGTGRFVLPVGQQFKAEYIGNNTIRMYDGKLLDNGAAAGIPAGNYIDLLIPEAGQGMKRNDLIVFQYEQESSTLIEKGTFVVVQGAETGETATDPVLTQDDLLSGEAAFDQFALWRVSVVGTTISAPEQMFDVCNNNSMHIANKQNPHEVTKTQVGLGNVPNVATNNQTPTYTEASTLTTLTSGEKLSTAFGKIKKAITDLISHLANKKNPHSVTAAQAGALSNAGDTFAKSSVGYGGPDTSGSVSFRSAPAANGGAGIWLYGNDHANGGKFRLQVYDADYGYTQLDGSPDGSLTWGKKDIRVEPPMESGVEYLTAEKWANSPVYCTRIDYVNTEAFGSASGEAEFSIPHGITGIYRIVRCDASKGTTYLFPYISTSGGITAISAVTASVITIRTVNTSWSADSSAWHFILYYTKA